MNIDDKQLTDADSERPMTLIERLEKERNAKSRLADYYKTVALEQFVGGLEQAIAIVKQHNEWVSVNERLPSVNLKVLVWHSRKEKFFIATYDRDLKIWLENGLPYSSNFLDSITHWCELPRPPSEVQDETQ